MDQHNKRPSYSYLLNFYNNNQFKSHDQVNVSDQKLQNFINLKIEEKINAKLPEIINEQLNKQDLNINKLNEIKQDISNSITEHVNDKMKNSMTEYNSKINTVCNDITYLKRKTSQHNANINKITKFGCQHPIVRNHSQNQNYGYNKDYSYFNQQTFRKPGIPQNMFNKPEFKYMQPSIFSYVTPDIINNLNFPNFPSGLFGTQTDIKSGINNDKIKNSNDKNISIVALTNDQNMELQKHLETLDSIQNIIDFEKIDQQKVTLFKNNNKFKILYNCIPHLKELSDLIGLKELKTDIFKHICYYSNNLHKDEDLNHIIITGPPGVGKTHVSKILGKLYLKMGFLNSDKFNSYKRSDLIGKYLGETSHKTQKAIDDSIGGVMFIDEAYSLGNSGKSSEDIYSKECIDTINRNLTENGNKFLCIIAGYEKSIETDIMSKNEGLRRRFGTKFDIKGYSKQELFEIFKSKLKEWTMQDSDYIKQKFNVLDKDIFKFYAADMETLFKLIRYEYALRLTKTINEPDKIITNKDFDKAYANLIILRENKDTPPFGLYM